MAARPRSGSWCGVWRRAPHDFQNTLYGATPHQGGFHSVQGYPEARQHKPEPCPSKAPGRCRDSKRQQISVALPTAPNADMSPDHQPAAQAYPQQPTLQPPTQGFSIRASHTLSPGPANLLKAVGWRYLSRSHLSASSLHSVPEHLKRLMHVSCPLLAAPLPSCIADILPQCHKSCLLLA